MSDEPHKESAPAAGSPPQPKPQSKPTPAPAPLSMPTPMPTPFPDAGGQLSKQVVREMRTKGQRYLFINVMLMFLVSIVVFTIASYFFLVPRLVTHDIEIKGMETKIDEMRRELADVKSVLAAEENATDEGADAKQAATPTAPAPAPAPGK